MPFFDPVTGTWVQDDLLGPPNPADLGTETQVTNPGVPMAPPVPQITPPPEAQATPETLVGASRSASASESGFSPERASQVDAYLGPKFKQDKSGLGAEFQAQRGREQAIVGQAAGSAIAAQGAVDEANAGLYSAKAAGEASLQVMQDKFNSEYQTAVLTAQAGVQEAKARYVEQMQRVGAMQVDPNRLMQNAGFGGRMGLGLAAFAEGFLGAKGIRISAMQNIKEAISQDIDAQLTAIQQGKDVTEGFKTLYEMARLESSDQLSLRERLHGFYLESAKHAIAADTLKYEGKLAQAQGQQAIAAIESEQAKSLLQIEQHTWDGYQKAINDAQQIRLGQARLGLERRSVAAAEEANRLKAQDMMRQQDLETGIVNPEGDGELLGYARSKEDAPKLRLRTTSVYSAARNANEVIDMMHKLGDVSTLKSAITAKLTGGRDLTTEEQQLITRFDALAVEIAKANNPDGRLSDQDLTFAKRMATWNETLRSADTTDAVASLFVSKLQNARDEIMAATVPVTKENRGNVEGSKFFGQGAYTKLEDFAAGQHRIPPETKRVDALRSGVSGADRLDIGKDSASLAQWEKETGRDVAAWSGGESGGIPLANATPRWAERTQELRAIAQGMQGANPEEAKLAREALTILANDMSLPDDQRLFAEWTLKQIK